jgi:hypothetical protein
VSERVVVCFRHRGKDRGAEQAALGAEGVLRRALALGGRVIAWQAPELAVDFAIEAIEDAVELVTEEVIGGRRSALPPRFSAGVAEGELTLLVELGGQAALGAGAALDRALALAHVARAGEVLLDPGLRALRSEELLTAGSRLGAVGPHRVRGLKLDLVRPLRRELGAALAALVTAARVGVEPFLPVEPGGVGIVVGPRGAGGTRALHELAQDVSLWVAPMLGEPLGALRAALERAAPDPSLLEPEHATSIESLLAGEGLDLEATIAALGSWLDKTLEPVVVVDDAEHVDADSLEVLRGLTARASCSLLVRTTRALPEELASLEVGASLQLVALPAALGTDLVRRLLDARIDERAAAHWARRGGGVPLAIVESLAEALESGELVVDASGVAPRARLAGRSRRQSAEHWIGRRLRFAAAEVRDVLEMLAALGGSGESHLLEALLRVRDAGFDRQALDRALDLLEARRLVLRHGEQLALPSATHVAAIDAMLEDSHRARIHRAVAGVLAESPRPMSAVAAAAHALLAGDLDGALPLARRGAAACQAAGLGATAEALVRFTESGDPAHFFERGLLGGVSTERAGLQRSDVPPALAAPPRAPAAEEPEPQSEQELRETVNTTLIGPMSAEPELAARLGAALKSEDGGAVAMLIAELRRDESQPLLADRVEAVACVARGQIGEALRLSRAVKRESSGLGAPERSRAALAHAIALAAAGRTSEALLEGLDSLARAREATDLRGERACARFLARLSTIAGSAPAADAWSALARAELLSG